nr:hypothetical protein [Tanacetum cinerariifolium]
MCMLSKTTMIKQKKENNYKMMNLPILSVLRHKKKLSLPHIILSKDELKHRNTIEYATEMELECAKLRELQNKLTAHQDTISVLTQQKDAQIKLYKTREDKDIEKVIDLENKVKVLDNIVNKTGQSVQTMNMLNNKCRTSFVKPGYLKKAKQANPRLIMSITKEQHQAFDNALVPREQRLRIRNCNFRLSTTFKPKEPTFQVALDKNVDYVYLLWEDGLSNQKQGGEEENGHVLSKIHQSHNQPLHVKRLINSKKKQGGLTLIA